MNKKVTSIEGEAEEVFEATKTPDMLGYNLLWADEFDGNEAYLPRAKGSNDESFHYQDQSHREFLSENWAQIKIAK